MFLAGGGPEPDPANPGDRARIESVAFDSLGRAFLRTDPDGSKTRSIYDDAGRTIAVVENYVDGSITSSGLTSPDEAAWGFKPVLGSNPGSADEDRFTLFILNDADFLTQRVAVKAGAAPTYQITKYVYGVATSGATDSSNVNSNDLVKTSVDPLGKTTTYSYNALGEIKTVIDARGIKHTYTRDVAGRVTRDEADVSGALEGLVDGTIKRLGYEYDARGNLARAYSSDSSGIVNNEVVRAYDMRGRLLEVRQGVTGAFASQGSISGVVSYAYADDASKNISRLLSITYPGPSTARTAVSMGYGANGGLDDRISRLAGMTWTGPNAASNGLTSAHEVRYAYLGVGQIVKQQFPLPGLQMNSAVDPNTGAEAPSGPVVYPGLDSFGRSRMVLWTPTDAQGRWDPKNLGAGRYAPPLVQLEHSFSKAGDVRVRLDTRASGRVTLADRDEQYLYDGLHRLTRADRGRQATSFNANAGAAAKQPGGQTWTLDSLGNWLSSTTDANHDGAYSPFNPQDPSAAPDFTDARTFDAANQLTSRSVSPPAQDLLELSPVVFDDVGNMVEQRRQVSATTTVRWQYQYDAWNRLTRVKVGNEYSPTVRAQYTYNALGQRATRGANADANGVPQQTESFFYDASWRLLEQRTDGLGGAQPSRVVQRVWGARYIDELLYAQSDSTPSDDFGNALAWYALTDRLFSVIGLTDLAGAPVERVRYSAYGVGRHTDAAWAAQKGDWNFDGQVGFEDMNGVLAAFSQQMSGVGPYDPDADFDADGLVGFTDFNKVLQFLGQSKARLAEGKISMQTVANTVGYAGYLYDPDVDMYLARRRWYDAGLGRWMSRDPVGVLGGYNLYAYASLKPTGNIDPSGLADYTVGREDPLVHGDIGSGDWNTEPDTGLSYVKKLALWGLLTAPAIYVTMPDAVRHMAHFLNNTGQDLHISLERFIGETRGGKKASSIELEEAMAFAESLADGTHPITSRSTTDSYVTPGDNPNWFFAVGGFQLWGKGTVKVCGDNFVLNLTLNFFDRYNWDTGKDVFGIPVDENLQPLVHEGIAREYNVRGEYTTTVRWKRGYRFPSIREVDDAPRRRADRPGRRR